MDGWRTRDCRVVGCQAREGGIKRGRGIICLIDGGATEGEREKKGNGRNINEVQRHTTCIVMVVRG